LAVEEKYQYDKRPDTKVSEDSKTIVEELRTAEYTVLIGRNNCGKSWLLKWMTQEWGKNCTYLGPARYENFHLLPHYTPTKGDRNQVKFNEFMSHWRNEHQNLDNSPLNLQQAIAELPDAKRGVLAEIVKLILNVDLVVKTTVPDNSMSQRYISVGDHNISFTSSGFRLITTIITSLLNTSFDTFLIDEPELGISPEAQGVLADFLLNKKMREKYFSHVKTLILATHSTIFLDRRDMRNNYQITKIGDDVSISRVETIAEFNRIHFFLLGNRFETLYLPTGIVIVEGKTDFRFIERVLALRYPQAQISILQANSDDRIKEVLNIAKGLFTDIQKSPYRERIIVVLDSVHSASLPKEIQALGVPAQNIIKWDRNGIEYVYPPAVMDDIYGAGGELTIVDKDVMSRNGIEYKKNDLAGKVVDALTPDTRMHLEFAGKLLRLLEAQFQVSKAKDEVVS
jgi:predicted ATPase